MPDDIDSDAILHLDYELSVREVRALIRAAEFIEAMFPEADREFACEACSSGILPAASAALKLSVALVAERVEL